MPEWLQCNMSTWGLLLSQRDTENIATQQTESGQLFCNIAKKCN